LLKSTFQQSGNYATEKLLAQQEKILMDTTNEDMTVAEEVLGEQMDTEYVVSGVPANIVEGDQQLHEGAESIKMTVISVDKEHSVDDMEDHENSPQHSHTTKKRKNVQQEPGASSLADNDIWGNSKGKTYIKNKCHKNKSSTRKKSNNNKKSTSSGSGNGDDDKKEEEKWVRSASAPNTSSTPSTSIKDSKTTPGEDSRSTGGFLSTLKTDIWAAFSPLTVSSSATPTTRFI
jgi:hypothetical protein